MKLCPAHLQDGNILISLCGTIYALLICSKGTSRYWYHFVVGVMSRSYAARELTYTLRDTSYDPLICSKGTYIYTSWYKLWSAHMQQGNLHIHFVVQVMSRSYAARELTYTLRGTSYDPLICSKRTYSHNLNMEKMAF